MTWSGSCNKNCMFLGMNKSLVENNIIDFKDLVRLKTLSRIAFLYLLIN